MASIGFIGLGMMGQAMVRRLLQAGNTVTVWNRTSATCRDLEQEGAHVAPDIRSLASQHEIVISMISTSEVLTEIASEVREAAPPNAVHADMSTVSPRTTQHCGDLSREMGLSFVHAPVLGSVPQVTEGSLLIFAGGDPEAVGRVMPVFDAMSRTVYTFSEPSQASHLKLTCNFFIASMIMTLGQGLSYTSAAGLDGATLLDVLSRSALAAPMFSTKGTNILSGNFSPRFFLDHMLKDVNLFTEAAAELGCHPQFGPVLADAFSRASQKGLGDQDYSSVVKVL